MNEPDRRGVVDAPFAVHVTRDAADFIRRRGGRVFLWQRSVGAAWVRDFVSLELPPPEIPFDCHRDAKGGVEICVAPDVEPREVIVRKRRWPFRGVRVYVDGKRWGRRGVTTNGV